MVELLGGKVFYADGKISTLDEIEHRGNKKITDEEIENARKGTMAYHILSAHNTSGDDNKLRIKFDALTSHDITFVGIIQTARASGLERFPIPYVLTNCHNSLCAVGGTINEDDHRFGLTAAQKYGGIYVPPHQAVIHQYMRECMAGCGKMILGSDSHTRYGALGTMAIGEGGPELVKQILEKTYDINYPDVVGVYLTGKPRAGVGPQDVALAIIGAVFKNGFVKNKVMEFIGDGVSNLSVDYRIGIDVMTTETTCLSSIWSTDEKVEAFLTNHNRSGDYKKLSPDNMACYDGMVVVDLSKVESMIAMPFHPSNVYTINDLNANLSDILHEVEEVGQQQLGTDKVKLRLRDKIKNGKLAAQQAIVAGCAGGGFENLMYVANAVKGHSIGCGDFDMSVYPASQPVFMELVKNGAIANIMQSGIAVKTAFCGPCFGAGDTPPNNGLSIRHTTRNFPNREGSKPGNGQISSVALMDARSIAATAINGGMLTPATSLDIGEWDGGYTFDNSSYKSRVYQGYGCGNPNAELRLGPNITDWPKQNPLSENILMKVACVISDPVTTTDELIPSGETSSYRSNPRGLAEFTLSRKDPEYVGRAKAVAALEQSRLAGNAPDEVICVLSKFGDGKKLLETTGISSVIYAVRPGDGSAREQAASCQRVLGAGANIALEYATKRYRSNLINWGMIPFTFDGDGANLFTNDMYIYVEGIREAIKREDKTIKAKLVSGESVEEVTLNLPVLTPTERDIILDGCLINYYNRK